MPRNYNIRPNQVKANTRITDGGGQFSFIYLPVSEEATRGWNESASGCNFVTGWSSLRDLDQA